MNKKGFTLIELLAVIVILAIISLIATPLVLNVIDNAKKNSFKASVYNIVETAEKQYYKNLIVDDSKKELIYLYKDSIESSNISYKYLEYKGTKPKNGNILVNKDGKVKIDLHNGVWCAQKNYEEDIVNLTKTSKENCYEEIKIPIINLTGSDISLDMGEEYIEPGYTVTDDDGEIVTPVVNILIKKNSVIVDKINTNEIGVYEIYYSYSKDNTYVENVRKVKIIDTTPPEISFTNNISIFPSQVETFDLMSGVTISDNSGEIPKVTTSGILSSVEGTYQITYVVTDKAGNKTDKVRTIKVVSAISNFGYTGSVQTWNVPANGTYLLEVWGAQGSINGGKGGYSKGEIILSNTDVLRVYVGGSSSSSTGGYNGGGKGGSGDVIGGGGGGGTDIRLNGTSNTDRIIVAGGGGGGTTGNSYAGGIGGGLSGTSGSGIYVGSGASQTVGGSAVTSSPCRGSVTGKVGELAVGGAGGYTSGYATTRYGGGAGGGGYYGGGGGCGGVFSNGTTKIDTHGGGGGGSGYIGGVTNAQTIRGNASMPNPSGGTMTGQTGNGYARITYLR